VNLVTGERLVFLRAGAETGGSYSENETHLQPGTAVPKAHLHLRQDEHFEVLSFWLYRPRACSDIEAGIATIP
jgi:hypothetical protein